MFKIKTILIILFGIFNSFFPDNGIFAQVNVAKIFSDNMVLQQNSEVSIWGWANPGDTISVTGSWNDIEVATVCDSNSKWTAKLNTPVASSEETSYTVTISGSNTIVLNNILIGEVWLLSGQSNMEMQLQGWTDAPVEGSAQAISSANFPNIRLITINKNTASEPQKDIVNIANALWKVCTPQTVASFSAVGFFFGKELYKNLDIPIGLVCSSWGGSSCETWATENSLDFVSDYAGAGPWKPKDISDNQTATVLYNGMIAPLVPFNFAGVCWYQGETNVGRSEQLAQLFPAMIEGWRSVFKKENLPFYFVQLAPYNGYGNGSLPVFWEAQANALQLHHTEMAETLDCGDDENIHPAKKEPIGYRLAQKALANVYGWDQMVYAGPQFDSLKIESGKIRLYFQHTGSGLKSANNKLEQFEIAGSNNVYYAATAEILGDEVLVHSSQVTSPKNVRYAWKNNAIASLYNDEDFPAIPFRTNPAGYISSLKSTFLSSSELINEGESVELRWTTLGAETVYLDSVKVGSTSEVTVTPDTTTSYILSVTKGINSETTAKTIYVIPKELNRWAKKKTTSASTFRTGYESKKAVDEILNTGWSSNYSNNQWLSVDMGEIIPVNLVVLRWGINYGKNYEIQVSDDFSEWETIYTEANGDGGIDFIPDLNSQGRYIRMKGIMRSGSQGYDVLEFNVFSSEFRQTGTLRGMNNEIMRGTPMVLGRNLQKSVEFATKIENWEKVKNNGFNTIRVCWVDPWYKNHGQIHWNVKQVLPYFDKCVENAGNSEMNIIINFHDVGPQQEFDTNYTFSLEKEFWDSIAPRYKNNDWVYYEIANEPTFQMNDYLKPEFKNNLLEIYNTVRANAPDREILMFSFNTIANEIIDVVENYKEEIDWTKTSVAYHMYNSTSSEAVQTLMAYHRVLCTEWNYDFVRISKNWNYIKQVDGFRENSQTLENIGSGWIDWRDWGDITLNELLDTLVFDARQKNYWWGEPIVGLKASAVHISNKKVVLPSGKSKQLFAWILPALAENQKIGWTTSHPNVVTVDETGNITATATQNKSATITAKSVDGGFSASCEVEVLAPEKKGAYPNGTPHPVPGTIKSTHYDLGGEGVGYHDNNSANSGDGIRPEHGVDTEYRLEEGSVGGIQNGEWLEYTLNVQNAGYFNIEILFASPGRFGIFHVELDEQDITGQLYITPSGSYDKFLPTKINNIFFSEGNHIMRIFFDLAAYNMGTISFNDINTTISENLINNRTLKLFPNPVKDQLFISGIADLLEYSIQSTSGQILIKGIFDNKTGIDTSFLLKGNYILSLNGKDFVLTEKFVKL